MLGRDLCELFTLLLEAAPRPQVSSADYLKTQTIGSTVTWTDAADEPFL